MTKQETRASIVAVSERRVTVEQDHEYEPRRVSTTYMAPVGGGYVRIDSPSMPQICEGLFCSGPTLSWDGREPLLDLIRREHARGRRMDRKERSK